MKQETLFTLDTPYRQKLDVEGFRFGKGEKSNGRERDPFV